MRATESTRRGYPPGPLVLPDSSLREAWTFSGASGRETFLAAALREPAAPLDTLRARLAEAVAEDPGRAARVLAVRRALERLAGEVNEVTVSHHDRPRPAR